MLAIRSPPLLAASVMWVSVGAFRINGASMDFQIPGATATMYSVRKEWFAGPGRMYSRLRLRSNGLQCLFPRPIALQVLHHLQNPKHYCTQMGGLTFCQGATTTVTLAVSQSYSRFQCWQRNGADIPGATGSTYTVPSTLSAGIHVLTVRVTDANGCKWNLIEL